MIALDPDDPNREMDLKIGAATVGGSPQMGINSLAMNDSDPSIRPRDLDEVNWSAFSTPGLARELQLSVLNPNKKRVLVFVCISGFGLSYLDRAVPEGVEELGDSRHPDGSEGSVVSMGDSKAAEESEIDQIIGSSEIQLQPQEQRVISVRPTVSHLWEPHKIRYHGRSLETDASVPFCIIDAFCGNRLLYGMTNIAELFTYRAQTRTTPRETPAMLLSRLQRMVGVLEAHGPSGLAAVQDEIYRKTRRSSDPRGMLTSMLHDESGWEDVSHWPTVSTDGLNKELGVVVANPWPFPISVSASLSGAAATLESQTLSKGGLRGRRI